jgi:hypothetical protein
MRTHSISVLIAGALLIGCAADATEEMPTRTKSKSSALWGCEVAEDAVVCTAALPASANAEGAYACKSDDTSARCPIVTVDKVAGLRDLFTRTGKEKTFGELTWACLTTGKNQSHCTKNLGAPMQGLSAASGGGTGAPAGQAPAGGNTPADGSRPQIPTTCEPDAWEPYFAQLATYAYNSKGVDIQFPVDIFDAHGSMIDAAMSGALSGNGGSTGTGGSCHDGEWYMRDQSWLDAVSVGCMQLNNAILAMCQQAAEYAPGTGKCTATGSW